MRMIERRLGADALEFLARRFRYDRRPCRSWRWGTSHWPCAKPRHTACDDGRDSIIVARPRRAVAERPCRASHSDGVEIAYREAGEGDAGPAHPRLRLQCRRQLGRYGLDSDACSMPAIASWQSTIAAMVQARNFTSKALRRAEDGRGCAAPPRSSGYRSADVMGYSMGARIAAFLALKHPERVRRVIFAGLGINMVAAWSAPGRSPRRSKPTSIDDVT